MSDRSIRPIYGSYFRTSMETSSARLGNIREETGRGSGERERIKSIKCVGFYMSTNSLKPRTKTVRVMRQLHNRLKILSAIKGISIGHFIEYLLAKDLISMRELPLEDDE